MKRKGILFTVTGALLLLAAVALVLWNLHENNRSKQLAGDALSAILDEISDPVQTTVTTVTTYREDLFAPYETTTTTLPPEDDYIMVEDRAYIGVLEIPELGLQLPVLRDWNKKNLKVSPCAYVGCSKNDTLIICGHNYNSHFGRLFTLKNGSELRFTDVNGNVLYYLVTYTDTIPGNDVPSMLSSAKGEWDLTLFTCTIGGQNRVTVRAVRTPPPEN